MDIFGLVDSENHLVCGVCISICLMQCNTTPSHRVDQVVKWPMVDMGLWYGQAYVMNEEHRCVLLMYFCILHRDTVTRS